MAAMVWSWNVSNVVAYLVYAGLLFTATAVALRAMELYMPAPLGKETKERLARAKTWLLTAEPQSTEDFTFRLLGLHWAGATAGESSRAERDLRPIGQFELSEDVRDVRFDGPLTDLQLAGDLLVRPSVRDQLQHLALARGEIVIPGVLFAGPGAVERRAP